VYKPVLIRGADGKFQNKNFSQTFVCSFFSHLQFLIYDFSLFSFFLIYNFHRKGSRPYTTGEMNSAQFGAIVGQVNLAHQPPMVRIIMFIIFSFFDSH
jgi:hypothetical protein